MSPRSAFCQTRSSSPSSRTNSTGSKRAPVTQWRVEPSASPSGWATASSLTERRCQLSRPAYASGSTTALSETQRRVPSPIGMCRSAPARRRRLRERCGRRRDADGRGEVANRQSVTRVLWNATARHSGTRTTVLTAWLVPANGRAGALRDARGEVPGQPRMVREARVPKHGRSRHRATYHPRTWQPKSSSWSRAPAADTVHAPVRRRARSPARA